MEVLAFMFGLGLGFVGMMLFIFTCVLGIPYALIMLFKGQYAPTGWVSGILLIGIKFLPV